MGLMMDESYEIAHSWFMALADSLALADFCQDNFATAPTVLLGFPMDDKPGQHIAPYVVVIPVEDQGGFEAKTSVSTVAVGMGLEDKATVQTGAAIEHRGYQTVRLLEKVVLQVLEETDFPPSRWKGETGRPGRAYFERLTFYQIDQARTI